MATVPSLKLVKSFSYRGSTRLWSNRYHFDNSAPADETKWTAFSDAVVNAEKACLSNGTHVTQIVEAFGYDAGSEIPVFNKTYATTGTLAGGGLVGAPGDAAIMVRYSTADRTAKNHPLYLFNWYHGVLTNAANTPDVPLVAMRSAYQTYAAAWISGFSDGSVTHHRAGPNGDLATGSLVDNIIRHRDFPAG